MAAAGGRVTASNCRLEQPQPVAQSPTSSGATALPPAPQTTSEAEPATAATVNHDPVDAPQHYTWHPAGIECLDVAEHFSYALGNVIKYVWRAGRKGDALEDLRKAETYLRREIARLEAQP